jgi:hypothetical protein
LYEQFLSLSRGNDEIDAGEVIELLDYLPPINYHVSIAKKKSVPEFN